MKSLSILIVHPEHRLATELASALERDGHEVVVVPDGERAIDRFIQSPADALIVEMLLPGRDGGTTVESIRWAPDGGEAHVVLLGSRGTPRDALRSTARRVRAIATLPGPVDIEAVRSLVADVAGGAETTRSAISARRGRPKTGEVWTDQTTRRGDNQLIMSPAPKPGDGARSGPGWDEELFTEIDEELTGSWGPGDFPGGEREGADVERRASAVTPEDELAGSLRSTAFPRLLHLLALSKRNGALVLSSIRDRRRTTTGESPKKVVFFRSGVPRYVQSNLVQECLGQILARGGTISQPVLEESVARIHRGEGRQGAVLLSMGAITPHQLRDGLEDQLRVKLFDLFAWEGGEYRFQPDEKAPRETVTLEMSLPEIVVDGVVHRIPPQRLLDILSPHVDRYVVPDRLRLGRFGRVGLAPEAKRVLHSLDGTQRLSSILEHAGERPGAAAQLVYALHCLDAIRFAEAPEPTTPLSENAATDSSAVTMHIGALREELGRLCRLLRDERYAEALGLSPDDLDDPGEATERAGALRARFHAVTEPGAAPREIRALAFEVCARLVHAGEALGAPDGQARSRLELAQAAFDGDVPTRDQKKKGREIRRHTEPSAQDEFQSASPSDSGLPHEERPTLPEKPGAAISDDFATTPPTMAGGALSPRAGGPPPARIGTPASPARITALSTEDDRDERETEASAGGSADDEIGDLSAEGTIPEDDTSLADETTKESDVGATADEPSLDEQVDRLYRAERHFRHGERALRRGKSEDALAAFARAVELCPDEGEFVSHLGYARYQAANDEDSRKAALLELDLGASLAPKIDITHMLLARVLTDRGEMAAARNAYGRALAANPDCAEALTGLEGLDEP